MPKILNQKGLAAPLLILLSSLAIIVFLFITNTFNFKDRLFNTLFPKPPSHAATVVKPVQLTAMYQGQRYPTGVALTGVETAQKMGNIISLSDETVWGDAKGAGFNGQFMYYVLIDQTEGPPGLDTLSAKTKTCTALGKDGYVSQTSNSVTTYFHGEFCQIHDSIVNKTPFDHDLDSSTPAVVATENWFIHDSLGVRNTFTQDGSRIYYSINPGNQNLREYFIARLLRDLNFNVGDKISEQNWTARIKATGIYLDNLGLGWVNFRNNSNNREDPAEFASSAAFADAVFAFVQQIHAKLHDTSRGYNYPVWGNMLAGPDSGSDWDRYIPYLQGGLKEDFVLNWGAGPYSTTMIQNQMNQAEKWINSGKTYIAVAEAANSTLSRDYKLSLATLLLVTDGVNGSYKLRNNDTGYRTFYDYPEQNYPLGAPKAAKFQKSASPLVLRRDFVCGFAEVDLTNKTGTISYIQGCDPVATPTPAPSASVGPTDMTNILTNPGCETSTSGWGSWQGILSRVTSSYRSGSASCQVTYGGVGGAYTIDDTPDAITSGLKQGDSYTASVYVKSDNSTKPVQLTLRLKGGATAQKSSSSSLVNLSTTWQKLSVSTTVDTSDRTILDFYVSQQNAVAGETFLVDDMLLTKTSTTTPTPIPTSTPTTVPTATPAPTATPSQDNINPTVSITYPSSGQTLPRKTFVNVAANASDNVKVTKVEFRRNNSLVCTDSIAPYNCSMFTENPSGRTITYQAKAYDAANNSATSTVSITSQ